MDVYIALLLVISACTFSEAADCVWNKDTDYPIDYPPVIIDQLQWLTVLPKLEGDLRVTRVAEGTALVLGCPETVITTLGLEVAEATCVGDQILSIDNQEYALSDLGCDGKPKETIFKQQGSCGVGGEQHTIGFYLPGYPEYSLITVCFDPVYQTTLYEEHVIRGEFMAAKDIDSSRPSFKSDSGFFTVSANTCYEQASQIQLMEDILGDPNVIDTSQSFYFARGHMAPDADFVTEHEQDATYYYINAVPQWQSFNNGNWKYLEIAVRDLAIARARDISVWSGGFDVLKLDDVNSNPVEIFLGLTEGQNVIPAPDITWKLILDSSTNEAAAVVGVNNPYLTSAPLPLCGSAAFCDNFLWIGDVDVSDYPKGATYCCTYEDLKLVIPSAPDLNNPSLLTDF